MKIMFPELQEAAAVRRRKTQNLRRTMTFTAIAMMLPSAIILTVVDVWPVISGILLSLRGGTLLSPGELIGFGNFSALLQSSEFWSSLEFTAIFTLVAVFGSYIIGLPLALLLRGKVFGRGVFRVLLLLPWVIPPIVSVLSWNWILGDQSGLLDQVIGWFGGNPIYVLSYPTSAQIAVCVLKVWESYPFMLMTLIAALEGIDSTYYEAASIDGASKFQQFRFITVPHISGVSVIAWTLMGIWSVNDFGTPWLLTQGGPLNSTETLPILAYKDAFIIQNVGQGAAIAVLSLILLLVLSTFLLRALNRRIAQ